MNIIFLSDNITNKVSDIVIDTPINRITWLSIAGTGKTVRYLTITSMPVFKNKLWNGITIVNDDDQDALDMAMTKDINNIDKILKSGFLVVMDYLRGMGLSKTNAQFKNDVITKYDFL
jgi:hypothetical protein